jgi:hypothetical protein
MGFLNQALGSGFLGLGTMYNKVPATDGFRNVNKTLTSSCIEYSRRVLTFVENN